METLLLVLDLVGTIVFALSGAMAGVKNRLDLFGVLVLSWPHVGQSPRRQHIRINLAVDQPTRARDRDALEAARHRFARDLLGDVQPGQRRASHHVGQPLVDGIVGADQEIRTNCFQLVGGGYGPT
jgi:Glycine transporter